MLSFSTLLIGFRVPCDQIQLPLRHYDCIHYGDPIDGFTPKDHTDVYLVDTCVAHVDISKCMPPQWPS
jgi:hypothetical protein